MANRADRRAARKNAQKVPGYHRLTKEQKLEKLFANGITVQDVEKAYEDGRHQGFKEGIEASGLPLFQTFYAALCLALNEQFGFGQKRCLDVLIKTDQHITNTLTSYEITQEVLDRIGLEIDIYDVEGHVRAKPPMKKNQEAKTGH